MWSSGEPDDLEPRRDLADLALERARELGVLIGKGGLFGNSLRIAPPLSITEDEVAVGLEVLEQVLTEVGR